MNDEYFRRTFDYRSSLFNEAAAFATKIGKKKLITISYPEDKKDGAVTVWYWAEE
ncbi:MAG TPA: hypothetical protein PLA68_10135 [Panacibacter sp.]|nr:hypothetical protein [Panacibacter sp.]